MADEITTMFDDPGEDEQSPEGDLGCVAGSKAEDGE